MRFYFCPEKVDVAVQSTHYTFLAKYSLKVMSMILLFYSEREREQCQI